MVEEYDNHIELYKYFDLPFFPSIDSRLKFSNFLNDNSKKINKLYELALSECNTKGWPIEDGLIDVNRVSYNVDDNTITIHSQSEELLRSLPELDCKARQLMYGFGFRYDFGAPIDKYMYLNKGVENNQISINQSQMSSKQIDYEIRAKIKIDLLLNEPKGTGRYIPWPRLPYIVIEKLFTLPYPPYPKMWIEFSTIFNEQTLFLDEKKTDYEDAIKEYCSDGGKYYQSNMIMIDKVEYYHVDDHYFSIICCNYANLF